MGTPLQFNSPDPLSDIELLRIIEKHLPAWLSACHSADSEAIALHEAAFGTSPHELFLFACAIKYAAAKGKNVHISADAKENRPLPKSLGNVQRASTFHERRRRRKRI